MFKSMHITTSDHFMHNNIYSHKCLLKVDKTFKCIFSMRQEIETHIIDEAKKQDMEQYKRMLEAEGEVDQETKSHIEHTTISWVPLINKIKKDLFIEREP